MTLAASSDAEDCGLCILPLDWLAQPTFAGYSRQSCPKSDNAGLFQCHRSVVPLKIPCTRLSCLHVAHEAPILDMRLQAMDIYTSECVQGASWMMDVPLSMGAAAQSAPWTMILSFSALATVCLVASTQQCQWSRTADYSLGDILGTCRRNSTEANITLLGQVYRQDGRPARLLTVSIKEKPSKLACSLIQPVNRFVPVAVCPVCHLSGP